MKAILLKALSGRWILTVTAGAVFAYCSFKGLLNESTIAAICSSVFVSYFQRNDRPTPPAQ